MVWMMERKFSLECFERITMHQAIVEVLKRADLFLEVVEGVYLDDVLIKMWVKVVKARGRIIDWANYRQGVKKCDSVGECVFCVYEYFVEFFLVEDYIFDGCSVLVFIMDYFYEVLLFV